MPDTLGTHKDSIKEVLVFTVDRFTSVKDQGKGIFSVLVFEKYLEKVLYGMSVVLLID
jgi:hypothetical protein